MRGLLFACAVAMLLSFAALLARAQVPNDALRACRNEVAHDLNIPVLRPEAVSAPRGSLEAEAANRQVSLKERCSNFGCNSQLAAEVAMSRIRRI